MDAPLAFGLRNALNAMHARFELHDGIDAIAQHLERDLLETARLRSVHIHGLALPPLVRSETRVHVIEIACKDCRFIATCTCANLDDDVLLVCRIGRDEHELDILFELRHARFDARDLFLGELLHVGITEHFLGSRQIVHETEVFLGSACQLTLVCVILGKFVVFALIGNDRRIAHLGFKFAISGNDLLELFAHFTLC